MTDRVVGRIAADRVGIVKRVLSAGVLCLACAPEGSELVDPDRVRVFASDLPAVDRWTGGFTLLRCDRCRRIWDPFRMEWTETPEPIEATQ
jgi:hypothetical protein